jgi:FdhD protein
MLSHLRRYERGSSRLETDTIVIEEPFEIRVAHQAFATVMRTPGHDRDLALGFLFGEGVIDGLDDVGALCLCERRPGSPIAEDPGNTVDLIPAAGRVLTLPGHERSLAATSSCGVCGKQTIAAALERTPPPAGRRPRTPGVPWPRWDPRVLVSLPERLREHQEIFTHTGALHAAGIFTGSGEVVVVREDIGRHNAVDKAVGYALARGLVPLDGHVLQVSGRVSFEIVQKAYRAGVEVVAAVSGVSSLAVDLAREVGLVLVGFVRGPSFCVYSGEERVGSRQSTVDSRQ